MFTLPPSQSLTSLSSSQGISNSFASEPTGAISKPLVVVTLSIGNEQEVIEVFEKRDVEKHARRVAMKYGLKEEFVGYLREELEGKIEIEMKRRKKGKE